MLDLRLPISTAEARFGEEVGRAAKAKGVDKARVMRRKNEAYFTRLTRACLGLHQQQELNDHFYALAVALPEVLLPKMHFLAWGASRKQAAPGTTSPALFDAYLDAFRDEADIRRADRLVADVRSGAVNKALICEGLSPTSDTILLLAELGRSLRVAAALGLSDTEVLVADVSWMRYNRSLGKHASSTKEFINGLRICLDKRKRLYNSLGIRYRVFQVSNFGKPGATEVINKRGLEALADRFRNLAASLWGRDSLGEHDVALKRLIGTPLHESVRLRKDAAPPEINALIEFQPAARALEASLENELCSLRTISELFSTFDRDVFVYYFAQYFAQRRYAKYVKIAPWSEKKFDLPFDEHADHFDAVTGGAAPEPGPTHYIYLPWYVLGRFRLLPYTSVSGDAGQEGFDLQQLLNGTILLDDAYTRDIDKVTGVITNTPLPHRNRLMSDLLSFVHVLAHRYPDASAANNLRATIDRLSVDIALQLFSEEDVPANSHRIYSDFMQSIGTGEAIVPFHLLPYLWDETDWTVQHISICAELITTLLGVVSEICDEEPAETRSA